MKPGDRVQLVSGGAIMTVEAVDGESITCVWQETGGTKAAPKFKTSVRRFFRSPSVLINVRQSA